MPYRGAIAIGRLVAWLCALLAATVPAISAAASSFGERWQVVLVAGDDAQPVFDNAVRAVDRFLRDRGVPAADIHRFSAAPGETGAEPAVAAAIARRIATLPVAPGGRCLVFITSHGERARGVFLAIDQDDLTPSLLARALAGNCAAVPTVVIVSACYSGSFAEPPMTAPNRIVLTAARADRPSFGCAADRTFTVFDQCLLEALPQVADWRALYERTGGCVRRNEHEMTALPSRPQAWFGAAVGSRPPWF